MRNFFVSLIAIMFIGIWVTGDVSADTITVNGTLDTSDTPLACRYTDVTEVSVSQTGQYSIVIIQPALFTPDKFIVAFIKDNPDPAFTPILGADSTGGTQTGQLTAGVTYYLHVRGDGGCIGTTYPVNYSFEITGPGDIIVGRDEEQPEQVNTSPQPTFLDGRINNFDDASPIAVYPVSTVDGTALHVYSSTGELLLVVPATDLANAPDNPSENVIIAEGNGVIVSRISGEGGGLWQINAPQYNGKTYVLIFPELFASGGYTSYEN